MMKNWRTSCHARWKISAPNFIAGLLALSLLMAGGPLSAQEKTKEKSLNEQKAELKQAWPNQVKEWKARWQSLRIIARPKTALSSYEANPEFFKAVTSFYDFIKGRELDVYNEQEGIPGFFPDREAYYNFLDTILPAMRERKFERNRLLSYQVHEIMPYPQNLSQMEVMISVTSDDLLRFGKLLIFRQQWLLGPSGWYPGKISADPATYWEKVR